MIVDRYTLEGTPQKLVETLRTAQVDDKVAESNHKKYGLLCGLAIALTILMLVCGFFPGAALTMILGIVCGYRTAYYRKRDLDDRKLAVPLRFLEMLRPDLSPSARVRLELDFRGYRDARFRRPDSSYSQHWMSLRARLADGNSLHLDLDWTIKRREKAKHRGTKVKERMRDDITLSFGLNPARYPSCQQILPVLGRLRPPSPLLLGAVRGEGSSITVSLRSPIQTRVGLGLTTTAQDGVQIWGDTLLASLVWFYRAAKEAKTRVIAPAGPPNMPGLQA